MRVLHIIIYHSKSKKMKKTIFSEYQKAIFNAVENNSCNLAINAVAGSGKTTTIVEACKRLHLSRYDIKFLAFNNSIVKELQAKIGDYADVSTLHSAGYKVLQKVAGGKRFEINDRKYMNIIRDCNMLAINSDDDKKNSIKALNNADRLFRLCRINLIRHGETDKIADIADEYSIVPLVNELQVVNELLKDAYTLDLNDRLIIDFTDMLVLPLSYPKQIPTYKIVFIDECQDLSTAQRELMLRFAKGGRFIAVGDRRQAINGFAGADCASFDKIANQQNTKELPLSVNYRCGKEIIKLAQEIVPEITAHEGAIEGSVETINKLELSTFKPNDMVLCRTSAPLVVMCLKLIRKGVTAVVKGRDIANGLISLIDKSKSKTIKGFSSWADVEKEKLAKDIAKKENMSVEEAKETGRYIAYCDRIDCILAIGENVSNISAVKQQIDEMFNDSRLPNAVTFSTAHKSKGLEADRVLILLPEKLPLTWKGQQDWEFEQEMNLKYVALTRAKKELVFVNLSQSALFQLEFEK